MKCKYATRFFLHLIASGAVRFISSVTHKLILAVIDSLSFFFPIVVFLGKDVIYLTVKFDNKDFSLRYI